MIFKNFATLLLLVTCTQIKQLHARLPVPTRNEPIVSCSGIWCISHLCKALAESYEQCGYLEMAKYAITLSSYFQETITVPLIQELIKVCKTRNLIKKDCIKLLTMFGNKGYQMKELATICSTQFNTLCINGGLDNLSYDVFAELLGADNLKIQLCMIQDHKYRDFDPEIQPSLFLAKSSKGMLSMNPDYFNQCDCKRLEKITRIFKLLCEWPLFEVEDGLQNEDRFVTSEPQHSADPYFKEFLLQVCFMQTYPVFLKPDLNILHKIARYIERNKLKLQGCTLEELRQPLLQITNKFP